MTIDVSYYCSYYPTRADKIRQRTADLWNAYMFCRAVKSGKVNGYFHVPSPPTRISQANVKIARQMFGDFIVRSLAPELLQRSFLVPVPSKDSWNTAQYRSLTMVQESLAHHDGVNILNAVRFNRELPRAAEGGARGVDALFPYLACNADVHDRDIILVDDIATSGSTLFATKQRLVDAGANVIEAVVCGRTSDDITRPAFGDRRESFPDWERAEELDFGAVDLSDLDDDIEW